MVVYCATTNAGKLREFQIAATAVCLIEPLPGLSQIPGCEETGSTFEENAVIKAVHYSRYTDGFLFVDDSGLEVDALNGAPGVYSARYAGPDASDEENNRKLLDAMADRTDRAARFLCVVALARAGEITETFRGTVEGQLLYEPHGAGGFGYDPLFFYRPFGCSFGEVSRERKQTVSHRGKALGMMLDYLKRFAEQQPG